MFIWVALKENVKQTKILWTTSEPCVNREFPREELKNFHTLRIFVFLHGLYVMESHAKKCVERYCELANKTTQQLYKVSTRCIDDHHFKEEEDMGSVGELSTVCSQIVLKCVYLTRIGRPDIFMVSEQTCTIDHKMDQSM